MKIQAPPNGHATEWFRLIMLGLNVLMIPALIWAVSMSERIVVVEQAVAGIPVVQAQLAQHLRQGPQSLHATDPVESRRVDDLETDVRRLEALSDR